MAISIKSTHSTTGSATSLSIATAGLSLAEDDFVVLDYGSNNSSNNPPYNVDTSFTDRVAVANPTNASDNYYLGDKLIPAAYSPPTNYEVQTQQTSPPVDDSGMMIFIFTGMDLTTPWVSGKEPVDARKTFSSSNVNSVNCHSYSGVASDEMYVSGAKCDGSTAFDSSDTGDPGMLSTLVFENANETVGMMAELASTAPATIRWKFTGSSVNDLATWIGVLKVASAGGGGPTLIPPMLHKLDYQHAPIMAGGLNGVLQ